MHPNTADLERKFGRFCMYCGLPTTADDSMVSRVTVNAATLDEPAATRTIWVLTHTRCHNWHRGWPTAEDRSRLREGLRTRERIAHRRHGRPYNYA